MTTLLKTLSTVSAVGAGLIAGTFFIFSVVIMPALAKGNPEHSVQVMRTINDVILRSPFMPVFGITSLLCFVLPLMMGVSKVPSLGWTVVGAAIFLVGVFGVTMAFNVPLNVRLDGDAKVWTEYLSAWTFWNHVRALASTAAMAIWILNRV